MNHPRLPIQDLRGLPQKAAAMINLLKFQGNLQGLFCREIETPFARSLPRKGILNQRKPRCENFVRVPQGFRNLDRPHNSLAFHWMAWLACAFTLRLVWQENRFNITDIYEGIFNILGKLVRLDLTFWTKRTVILDVCVFCLDFSFCNSYWQIHLSALFSQYLVGPAGPCVEFWTGKYVRPTRMFLISLRKLTRSLMELTRGKFEVTSF